MEPTFVVVGLNHRTSPVEVRERFWMGEEKRLEALTVLSRGEGIEEALVFSTCNRTEFLVWGDATLAMNSILRFLTAEYNLKLCEWRNFYRFIDDQALTHVFRVSCGLDSMRLGEDQIARQVDAAWKQAKEAESAGARLEAVLRKALSVRRQVRRETGITSGLASAPQAAVALAQEIYGSLAERKILLIGAGRMAESVGQRLRSQGAVSVCATNRSDVRALELARRIGIQSSPFEQRWSRIASADMVITATSAPGFVLKADEMKQIATRRQNNNLVLIDLGMPRNIEPAVSHLGGVLQYGLADLERRISGHARTWKTEVQAEEIVLAEAHSFGKEILAEGVSPQVTELRSRLDEICRQELESFRLEQGPFPKDQDQLIAAVSARITHKIAGSLARELKGPETRRHGHTTVGL